jgi:hypothetical protein
VRGLGASPSKRLTAPAQNIERLVRTTVDDVFSSLGDSAKQGVYLILSKDYNIKKREIPHKIQELGDALESIFGLGGKLVEIQIMERLFQRIGGSFEYVPANGDLIFSEYVEAAKLFLQNHDSLDCVFSIENPRTSPMAMHFRTRCL